MPDTGDHQNYHVVLNPQYSLSNEEWTMKTVLDENLLGLCVYHTNEVDWRSCVRNIIRWTRGVRIEVYCTDMLLDSEVYVYATTFKS